MIRRLPILALLALACASCGLLRPDPPEYPVLERSSGLRVQEKVVPESGPTAASGDRVTVHYEMKLIDGPIVDSSYARGTPVSFVVGAGEVPPGLEQGVVGMRLFGRRKLIVPPELGFGGAGRPPRIPPQARLRIVVELLGIETP